MTLFDVKPEEGDVVREPGLGEPPTEAEAIFGPGFPGAIRYAEMLAEEGLTRGLIGPRELPRLWERHLLNSAVIGERVPEGSGVLDVGSGAGFPGVPLALARPDLRIVLLEPMARRVDWLESAVDGLGLSVTVRRGRAGEDNSNADYRDFDIVTARAVAPLGRLAAWCLPCVRLGGELLAVKGANARDEMRRDANDIEAAGGGRPELVTCGARTLQTPTTVVAIGRTNVPSAPTSRKRRQRRSRSARR